MVFVASYKILSHRVNSHLAIARSEQEKREIAIAWNGYIGALFEWHEIETDVFEPLRELLPEFDDRADVIPGLTGGSRKETKPSFEELSERITSHLAVAETAQETREFANAWYAYTGALFEWSKIDMDFMFDLRDLLPNTHDEDDDYDILTTVMCGVYEGNH